MILDGINLEDGAKRGVEKVTREIRKKLITRRSIDCAISLTFFAATAYYKRQKNIKLQIICLIVPIMINGIVVFAYNAYLLHSRGKVLVRILSNTVESTRAQILSKKKVESEDDKRLEIAFKKFQRIIPIVIWILILSSQSMFVMALWAILTIDTVDGMAFISPFVAFMISFWMLGAFMVGNKLFIIWFPSEIKQKSGKLSESAKSDNKLPVLSRGKSSNNDLK